MGVVALSMMNQNMCVLKADASVWCWGSYSHNYSPVPWVESNAAITGVAFLGHANVNPCYVKSDATLHFGVAGQTPSLSCN